MITLLSSTVEITAYSLDADGLPTAGDGNPTAVLWRNKASTAETVTVATTATTGLFSYTFTVPAGWSVDDVLELHTAHAISAETYRAIVWRASVYEAMRGTNSALTGLGTNAPANWVNAAAIAANALDGKGNWNVGKTGYTLQATTGLGNQTANITGNLSGSVGSVTGAVGSVTGNVGGNVSGSVGSVTDPVTVGTNNDKTGYSLSQAFPANFAAMGISESGHIERVVLVDTTTTNTDMLSAAGIRTAVGLAAANLDTQLGDIPTVSEFDARLSATRAGYIDKLNVTGNVASQADVAAITQAQRVRLILPSQIERPDSGSQAYRLYIYVYNETHIAEDLDGLPTVTAENAAGTDRSSNLGTVVKPTGTGIYYVDYTLSVGDAIEQLVFKVDATKDAVTTEYATSSQVVDTTAVDFTSTDRDNLLAILEDTGTTIPGTLAELDTAIGTRATPEDVQITVNPTQLSEESVSAIQEGLATSEEQTSITNKLNAIHGTDPGEDDNIKNSVAQVSRIPRADEPLEPGATARHELTGGSSGVDIVQIRKPS